MFEQRKTITVNGVSFNMILVEGDKFNIDNKEVELDDFCLSLLSTNDLKLTRNYRRHACSKTQFIESKRFLSSEVTTVLQSCIKAV